MSNKFNKKKLLMYAHYYYPDVASTAQILTELAEGMRDTFEITVICVVPSYTGKIDSYYKQKKYYKECIRGIDVIRVRVPEFSKVSKISRIKNLAVFFIRAVLATLKLPKQDYIYTISQPPIMGGILGVIGKWLKHGKLIYNIQDFNPEQTMAVGYIKHQWILKLMLFLDKFSCKQSGQVIVVGRDMVDTLITRFEKDKKVPNHTFINNWIDENEIYPLDENHPMVVEFKTKYGLTGKYVVMYSGNLGLYYDLENIMCSLKQFRKRKDVVFAFIGEGSIKEKLMNCKEKQGLKNVVFIPYQPKEDLNYSLNAGDIHWVVNAKGIKGVSVPSKLYGVIAAGKPVLGVLEKNSEARLIVDECGCGIVCDPVDYEHIARNVSYVLENRELFRDKGLLGREYLEKYLTKDVSVAKYIKSLVSLDDEDI